MKAIPDLIALLVSVLAPLGWMLARWLAGAAAFPTTLVGWILLEAAIQGWLLALRLRQRIPLARLRQWQFGVGLVLGLPATILCVYMGAMAEARLIPFLLVLLLRSGWIQALYALALFVSGLLLFFPFFEGNVAFLALELFRPAAGVALLFTIVGLVRSRAAARRRRLVALSRRKSPKR